MDVPTYPSFEVLTSSEARERTPGLKVDPEKLALREERELVRTFKREIGFQRRSNWNEFEERESTKACGKETGRWVWVIGDAVREKRTGPVRRGGERGEKTTERRRGGV